MITMTHNTSIFKSFVNLLIVNKCIRETHPEQRYFAEIIDIIPERFSQFGFTTK